METKSEEFDGTGVLARLEAAEEIIDDVPLPSNRLPMKFRKYCSRSRGRETTKKKFSGERRSNAP